MTTALIGLGLIIVLFVLLDIVITTLTVGGAGPLMGRVANGFWRGVLLIHRRRPSHSLLAASGWLVLLMMVVIWLLLTWLGWTLVFAAAKGAVVSTSSGVPATLWERVYFTGFTIATLGLGDFRPQHPFWQLATAVAAANGFFLVTLGVAYLLPVVAAVTAKRGLATYISTLGGTGDDILRRNWNGENFGQLDQHLINLAPAISQLGESHLAYPILYYFHSVARSRSLPLSVVALDEALTLLEYGVPRRYRPDASALGSLRRANAAFLRTLQAVYLDPAPAAPPLPPLERLRSHGIPTVSDEEFYPMAQCLEQRRRLLLALIHSDGRGWDAIASSDTTSRAFNLDDYALASGREAEEDSVAATVNHITF